MRRVISAAVVSIVLAGCAGKENPFNDPLLHLAPNMVFDLANKSGLDAVTVEINGPCRDLGTVVMNRNQTAHEGCHGAIGSRVVSVRAVQPAAGYDHSWSYTPLPDESDVGVDFAVTLSTDGIHATVY